jgi:hypothetical protein
MTPVENRLLSLYGHIGSQAAEWADRVPLIADAGFHILNGPPVVGGPMAVSLNPGLSKAVRDHPGVDFWPKRWPECPWYPKGISPFAKKLIQIFDGAGIDLESVNAGYVLVCRSKSLQEWKTKVPLDIRKYAEKGSLEALGTIVSTLKPVFIYAAGFSTFRRMGCSVEREEHGRRKGGAKFPLLHYGFYSGVPVVASHHPSGARLSRENLDQIALGLSRMCKS